MGQHSSAEEHFTLTNTVQVAVQLQRFDLTRKKRVFKLSTRLEFILMLNHTENDSEAVSGPRLTEIIWSEAHKG